MKPATRRKTPPHRKEPAPGAPKYPWEKWFAESTFTLMRGRDYTCETWVMAQQVRNMGRPSRYDCKVSITFAADEQSFTVTLYPRG